jgi:hypothetical protein
VNPTDGEYWQNGKAVYRTSMKIIAVVAVSSNVIVEAHYRQLTRFQLPAAVAPLVSHLAAASASMFVGGAILAVMIYFNERRRRK